jgi:hypothetical protein
MYTLRAHFDVDLRESINFERLVLNPMRFCTLIYTSRPHSSRKKTNNFEFLSIFFIRYSINCVLSIYLFISFMTKLLAEYARRLTVGAAP